MDVISIHAAHAGCDPHQAAGINWIIISIHAAHAGCDLVWRRDAFIYMIFQSTQPMRAATELHTVKLEALEISIHAAHAGCDYKARLAEAWQGDFNPRSPCGLRRCGIKAATIKTVFQSTQPMRAATRDGKEVIRDTCDFNPRSPCGLRLEDKI